MTKLELENAALRNPEEFYRFLELAASQPHSTPNLSYAIATGARWLPTRRFCTLVLSLVQAQSEAPDPRVQLEAVRALARHAPWRRDVWYALLHLTQHGAAVDVRQDAWWALKNARETAKLFQSSNVVPDPEVG